MCVWYFFVSVKYRVDGDDVVDVVCCQLFAAGIHRTMENAKIRSLRMDSKVWTGPLIKVHMFSTQCSIDCRP